MDAEPDIPWPRFAAFIHQHTHDVRNGLNGLDLEIALLRELVTDDEGRASVERMQGQVRSLAGKLRSLNSFIEDPHPVPGPIAARDLLLIWRETHAALTTAPEVRWADELHDEKVEVDVEMMAMVFRELLVNAAAFSPGETVAVAGGVRNRDVVFDLREPKKESVDTRPWGQPLLTTRNSGYGLGLWAVHRLVAANGGKLSQRYIPEDGMLTTQLTLSVR